MGIGTSGFPMGPMGMRISDCRYMRMGTGIQIREWEYNNGNEFSKLNGNQLLFAIVCDVLAPLQYALGLVADAAITLTQFDISD